MEKMKNVKNMKFMTPLLLVLIAVAVAAVSFFFIGRSRQVTECSLYFLNPSGTSLALENRRISYYDESDLLLSVIKELVKGPENNQNMRVISRHASINSVADDGEGNVIADFSEEFLKGGKASVVLGVYAVAKTISSMDGINSVKVTINGEDFVAEDGTVIGYLTADDINLAIDTDTSETRTITLYFTDIATQKLATEQRTVKITDQQPLEQYIIAELIKGTENVNHRAVLSSDTTLISVNVTNNIGFVNFGRNFLEKNGSTPQEREQTIFAIVNSMTELDSINRVQFLIEGKKTDTFGDIDISHPIGRNSNIIEQ